MMKIITKSKYLFNIYRIPIIYTLSSVLKALATLVSGFIIAKFIFPDDFGLWTTLSLLISYSLIFQGGVINGLNLELPYMLGDGNIKKAHLYTSVTQSFTLCSAGIIFIIAIIVFNFYSFTSNKEMYGFLGVSMIIILTFFQNFFLSTFRSNNQFLTLSYIQIFEALLNLITISLVFYFGFYGMVIKAGFVIFLYVLVLAIYRPIKVPFKWNSKVFMHLIKIGLPIFILAYIETMVLTLDKILLLKYTNLTSVGIYSFAFYSFAFVTLFSTSLASYIYPKLTYKYGETKDKLILWIYVKKITIILLALQLPLAIIGYFIIPYGIQIYFKNYAESIVPMQILLFAGVFKGSIVGANVMWSIKKWKYMILYQLGYALLFLVLTYLFVLFMDDKLIGVSLGVLIANILNLLNGYYLSYRATNN